MSSQNLRPPLDESLEHRSLRKIEGFWKVVHLGNLITAAVSVKTPRLVIYLRKLVNQENPITPVDFETPCVSTFTFERLNDRFNEFASAGSGQNRKVK
jgi:hypothetical protein